MRISRRQGERNNADPSLLRTCQVCSHAKLRCERTQDSGLCDRCLRLKKTCIFPPARRGQAPAQRTNRISQLEAEIARLDNILASQQGGSVASDPSPGNDRGASRTSSAAAGEEEEESRAVLPVNVVSQDPFKLGLLTTEKGDLLLNRFRISLTPNFPFIIIPESVKMADLHRDKPIVCLAILFAASHDDGHLQARLSQLFERVLATALLQGRVATLENLQGLVIYIAWTHFQPRPRKHTQDVFLAMSIMYDLDLHKPQDLPTRRNEDGNSGLSTGGLTGRAEEVRALVGLYSVASCASVILDKFHCFPTVPLLAESCVALAQRAEYSTDRYLPQIVGLLRMIEEVYDIAKNTTSRRCDETSNTRVTHLQHQWRSLKESMPPHAASFPFLNIQTHTAEFLLREINLPGSPVVSSLDPSASLAETISAVKSLMEILLSAEPAQQICFINPVWVTFGYGLSLGVKLDMLCTTCGINPTTAIELRRSLDIAGTLKRLIERLRMSTAQSKNVEVEMPHPLEQFVSRAEEVERWYARHVPHAVYNSSQQNPETFTSPGLMKDRPDSLPGHLHPAVEDDTLLGPVDSQDLGSAFDIDMFAFEGLDFEGMDFMMDPQEGWNPFVFSDGDYQS